MASGGVRHDFTEDDGIVLGEDRPVHFNVTDGEGNAITDFSGWELEWFLIQHLFDADGVEELREKAVLMKPDGAITKSPQGLDMTIAADEWPSPSGMYYHELWRVNTGSRSRISYGNFPIQQ